jgi:hypothetical protein
MAGRLVINISERQTAFIFRIQWSSRQMLGKLDPKE